MKPRKSHKVKIDFQVFAKPIGDTCNMACKYCYYSIDNTVSIGAAAKSTVSDPIHSMPDDLLETYICQHIQVHPGPVVRFSWHGGEPTLLGVDFFKRAVGFQKKHQPPGVLIQNGIQTNGILLNETWCRFFKKEGFTVGLSLDGPEHLHNKYRMTKSGKGTHSRVMNGQRLLQKNQILKLLNHSSIAAIFCGTQESLSGR